MSVRIIYRDKDGGRRLSVHTVTHVTATMVWFDDIDGRVRRVDRRALESHGKARILGWIDGVDVGDPYVYTKADMVPASADDISALRKAMIAAHPDQGGTSEALRAARERYLRAKGAL